MKEQTFKFKIEIFGVQRIANVKATTLEQAKAKLSQSILSQTKILSTEYTDTKSAVEEKLEKKFEEFTDIMGEFFGGRKK